jgi:hypothetical protein
MRALHLQNAVRNVGIVGVTCMALSAMTPAVAAPLSVSLSDLISNQGTIQVGDKLFSNFGYITSGSGFPAATDVQVQGEVVGPNNGIGFLSAWHANSGQGLQTAKITYNVSVLGAPGYYISDVHLDGDPSVVGGTGLSMVKLTASDTSHTAVLPQPGLLQIYSTDASTGVVNAFDNTVGLPANLRSLNIETTILQSSDAFNVHPSVLHIQESFSQAVPEPSTIGLTLTGLLAMGFVMRRNKSV